MFSQVLISIALAGFSAPDAGSVQSLPVAAYVEDAKKTDGKQQDKAQGGKGQDGKGQDGKGQDGKGQDGKGQDGKGQDGKGQDGDKAPMKKHEPAAPEKKETKKVG